MVAAPRQIIKAMVPWMSFTKTIRLFEISSGINAKLCSSTDNPEKPKEKPQRASEISLEKLLSASVHAAFPISRKQQMRVAKVGDIINFFTITLTMEKKMMKAETVKEAFPVYLTEYAMLKFCHSFSLDI